MKRVWMPDRSSTVARVAAGIVSVSGEPDEAADCRARSATSVGPDAGRAQVAKETRSSMSWAYDFAIFLPRGSRSLLNLIGQLWPWS